MTWPPPTAIETTHHWPPEWFHDPNRDDHHEHADEYDGWSDRELAMRADGAAADMVWGRGE